MKIKYNLTGEARKALVAAISVELGIQASYRGAPTFAYQVGEYTIDQKGMVTGPDNRELVKALHSRYGRQAEAEAYDAQIPEAAEPPAAVAAATRAEERPDPTSGRDRLTIELPKNGMTDTAIANLEKLVTSKATLIKKALGTDDLTIEQTTDTLRFPWLYAGLEADEVNAYARFIGALCAMAKNQKRAAAKEKPVVNEKYEFRCFLIRLGFIGGAYKAERKILIRNLSGNASFKNGVRKPEDAPIPGNTVSNEPIRS